MFLKKAGYPRGFIHHDGNSQLGLYRLQDENKTEAKPQVICCYYYFGGCVGFMFYFVLLVMTKCRLEKIIINEEMLDNVRKSVEIDES